MKLFIDTANVAEIEAALDRGIVHGVTTNPSILAKEPNASFDELVSNVVAVLKQKRPGMHLSVEVFSTDPEAIVQQALDFPKRFGYDALSVKVQVGWDELKLIRTLADKGVSVNCTACMTVPQAVMAAKAGAKYVSLFWGRIRDAGTDPKFAAEREQALADRTLMPEDFDPASVVRRTRALLDQEGLAAEIIVGSIRGASDIHEAGLAGAHIVTVPPKFFQPMASHYKTTEVIGQFLNDFQTRFGKV